MCIKKNVPQNCGGVVRPIRPILNRTKIEELLGEKFENVVMYDLNTNQINRSLYNGFCIVGERQISKMASEIKTQCSIDSVLSNRTPVAIFAKIYDCDYTNAFVDRRFFKVPPYNVDGKCVAGSVIFYNNQTKKYESLPQGWFYAGGRACRGSASEEALLAVLNVMSPEILKQQRQR